MIKKYDYLAIIQARLGSTRLPGKVMMTVRGIPMVRRVWMAAKAALVNTNSKVIVAWPERYPDVDENNVLERFKRLSEEFPSKHIIRLTADCPLLDYDDIIDAIYRYTINGVYYSNHKDGHDVQIFSTEWFHNIVTHKNIGHKEHVIADFNTVPKGLSVDTIDDLKRVRQLA